MATLNLNKKKFIDEENLKTIVKIGINFGEKLNALEAETITDYDETKSYIKGESCYHDNYIYRCKSTATGVWNPDRWEKVCDSIDELTLDEIKAMLGLTTEQLTTLSSIILDSEVRLDKTYSSSKIYTDIQNAIDTAKAYTLSEIGKASGTSYKIANSTSDMTDEKVIYLLQNGSTYDMYIVDSGTPVKIGDTTIDLSGYYTKTEIENDFLKKTDATSTYATKTEVNDKVDKASILSATSSTATDDNLYSAKLINSELDKKINKTSITTTINSTSTDDEVPSAKIINSMLGSKYGKQPASKLNEYTTMLDWAKDNMGNSVGYTGNNFEDCPLVNQYGTIVCLGNAVTTGLLVIAYTNWNDSIFVRKIKGGNMATANWVTNWKRVCSTTVEDVSLKTLTNSSNIKSDAVITYTVKNGMCTVSANTISSTKMSTGNIILATGLPTPSNTSCWYSLVTNSNATNAPMQNLLVRVDKDGNFIGYIGTDNVNYFGTFSYPVKES